MRAIVLGSMMTVLAFATTSGRADDKDLGKEYKKCVDRGIEYLKKNQAEDGSFSSPFGPGVTALAVAALVRNGVSPEDPVVKKGIAYLEKHVKKDGGIYDKQYQTYTTGIALMAFKDANAGGKFDTIIKNAAKYLKMANSPEGIDPKDAKFGGANYGGKGSPDLSNTQFFMEALIAAGIDKKDPALENALKFVSRCQNLPSEENTLEYAKKASKDDKGGFVYSPVDPEKSKAKTPEGGLKSAGAMTYAGLKSFLYMGVDKNDPRVKAAVDWIQRHYTLEENPGSGKAGLFYYYQTLAKALDTYGEKEITDAKGTKHDWRKELIETLAKQQRSDGSWVNKGDPMGESDPKLATSFALLALSYAKPK